MTKQQQIERLQRENEALSQYARNLEARQTVLIAALADISAGFGIEINGINKAAYLAKRELAKVAEMPLKKVYL